MAKNQERINKEIVLEMGYTRKEFLQTFAAVTQGKPFEIEQNSILFKDPERQVLFTLGNDQYRKLGSLMIPKIEIKLLFTGYSSDEQARFLKRFSLYYHKGGG